MFDAIRLRTWCAGVAALAFAGYAAAGDDGPAIMPLSEVEPGMRGEWKTVISGTEIESFPLEVVGIGENFIGPKRSLIICKALDDLSLVTGPVSGMSGSPVFIDGRLVGAYAYGFRWAKEQALIGVTPIEDMMEIWDWAEDRNRETTARRAAGRGAGESAFPGAPFSREAIADGTWREAKGAALPSRDALREAIQPLPTPLFVSGISPRVLAEFESKFRRRGLELQAAPMGRGSEEMDTDLQPGSAVAGVLMSGDFSFAATGTVTHRDGDRILAFGHSFFGDGDVDIPMAPAEVMTVVQSVVSSFKLSNPGPVVGSILQDRQSGIAGTLGWASPVTNMEIRVHGRPGETETYRGDLFEDEFMSPLISAMALMESLLFAKPAGSERTFFVETRWEIEGEDPIVLKDAAAGYSAPLMLAFDHLFFYDRLIGNPFHFPRVSGVEIDVTLEPEQRMAQLDSVQLDRTRFRAGEEMELLLRLRNYRGDETVERIRVPIPERTRDGEFTVFVGDARATRSLSPARAAPPTTFSQFLDRLRDHYSHREITVMVLEAAPGLAIEGRVLPDVLPSVGSLYRSQGTENTSRRTSWKTLWEDRVTLDGEFRGSFRRTLTLER